MQFAPKFRCIFAGLIVCLLAMFADINMANAAPDKLKVASAFATRLPEMGSQGVAAVRLINSRLGHRLNVTLYDPGKLAPPGRYLDPVTLGAIDAAWSTPNLLSNKDPVFGILGAPPLA